MDSRTGLGRFRQFRISNYDLMMKLIDYCRDHTVGQILELPDVAERIDLYRQHETQFREQVLRCSTVHRDLVVLDLRNEETIYAGNRFMIYALFPQCRVSMHVIWGFKQQNTVFAIGKSIIDRSSPIDVGATCLGYGGGGHAAAGTCQVDNARATAVMAELIEKLSSPAHRGSTVNRFEARRSRRADPEQEVTQVASGARLQPIRNRRAFRAPCSPPAVPGRHRRRLSGHPLFRSASHRHFGSWNAAE